MSTLAPPLLLGEAALEQIEHSVADAVPVGGPSSEATPSTQQRRRPRLAEEGENR